MTSDIIIAADGNISEPRRRLMLANLREEFRVNQEKWRGIKAELDAH